MILCDIVKYAIAFLCGSGLISVLADKHFASVADRRNERNELIAKARLSVVKRAELCFRIRRRSADGSEDVSIKNAIHDIQEENEYYSTLFYMYSDWFGGIYSQYLHGMRKLTGDIMSEAWKSPGNPSADIEAKFTRNLQLASELSEAFVSVARYFFHPRRAAFQRALSRLGWHSKYKEKNDRFDNIIREIEKMKVGKNARSGKI